MLTTESQRVLVAVQDDAAREALIENLAADGHDPRGASSLGHTRSHLKQQVDLLLVDLGTDTVHLIDVIRGGRCPTADEWLPIIAGSASSDLFQPVRLLERGADDVIYEPWLYLEVRARLGALMRRITVGHGRQVLRAGALRVDLGARRVWIGEAEIGLTNREFELLRVLISEPDRVFTREELLRVVWGWDEATAEGACTRTLDSHASRLRRQLNACGGDWVRNVWGIGYRLVDTGLLPV